MNTIITIRQLNKVYKGNNIPALQNLSLNIDEGITGFLGPNGAGKTTLINILTGLISAFDGEVRCFDFQIPKELQKIKPLIGIVPQEIALYYDLTALENIIFFGSLYKIKTKDIIKKANIFLDELGLYDRRNDKIKTYSGGMKRRINLICGLLHQPKLLLLDEPTTGIDVQSKKVILDFLRKINYQGTNIIYTSHQMEDVENLCDTIKIIDNGRLIADNTMQNLLTEYDGCKNLEDIFIHLTGKQLRD